MQSAMALPGSIAQRVAGAVFYRHHPHLIDMAFAGLIQGRGAGVQTRDLCQRVPAAAPRSSLLMW